MAIEIDVLLNKRQLQQEIDRGVSIARRQASKRSNAISFNIDEKGFRKPLGRITGDLDMFDSALAASNARVIAFGASTAVIAGLSKAFKDLVTSTIELESSLADINRILNVSTKEITKFGDELFDIGKENAVAFKEAATAATEFARQGLSLEETLKRTNDALKLTRLTGVDAEKSVNLLTATVNAFDNELITTTSSVNKFVSVETKFAVSAKDLVEAFGRSAAAAKDAEVNFDELSAAVTVVQESTGRGGAVIGNAMRTIFAKLQKRQTLDALEEYGIAVRDIEGQTLPAIQVLRNFAGTYDDLTDSTRTYLSQKIADIEQSNILSVLVSDLAKDQSTFNKVLKASVGATNEADSATARLNKTLSAMMSQTSTEFQKTMANIGKQTVEPVAKNLFTSIKTVLEELGSFFGESGLGEGLGEGILGGLRKVLGGPGLVSIFSIVAATIAKTLKDLSTAVPTLLKITTETKKRQIAEEVIARAMEKQPGIAEAVARHEGNAAKQAQILASATKSVVDSLQSELAVRQKIAATIVKNPALYAPVGAYAKTSSRMARGASGYMPGVMAESADIKAGVGGASRSAKPVVVKNFPFSGGAKGTMIANTSEYIVPNFSRGGAAVFNPEMISKFGLPPGSKPIARAAGGFPATIGAYDFSKKGLHIGEGSARTGRIIFNNRMNRMESGSQFLGMGLGFGLPMLAGMLESAGTPKGMTSAMQGAGTGAMVGSFVGPLGAAIGSVVGALSGTFLQSINSSSQALREAAENLELYNKETVELTDLGQRYAESLRKQEFLLSSGGSFSELEAVQSEMAKMHKELLGTDLAEAVAKSEGSIEGFSRLLDEFEEKRRKSSILQSFRVGAGSFESLDTLYKRVDPTFLNHRGVRSFSGVGSETMSNISPELVSFASDLKIRSQDFAFLSNFLQGDEMNFQEKVGHAAQSLVRFSDELDESDLGEVTESLAEAFKGNKKEFSNVFLALSKLSEQAESLASSMESVKPAFTGIPIQTHAIMNALSSQIIDLDISSERNRILSQGDVGRASLLEGRGSSFAKSQATISGINQSISDSIRKAELTARKDVLGPLLEQATQAQLYQFLGVSAPSQLESMTNPLAGQFRKQEAERRFLNLDIQGLERFSEFMKGASESFEAEDAVRAIETLKKVQGRLDNLRLSQGVRTDLERGRASQEEFRARQSFLLQRGQSRIGVSKSRSDLGFEISNSMLERQREILGTTPMSRRQGAEAEYSIENKLYKLNVKRIKEEYRLEKQLLDLEERNLKENQTITEQERRDREELLAIRREELNIEERIAEARLRSPIKPQERNIKTGFSQTISEIQTDFEDFGYDFTRNTTLNFRNGLTGAIDAATDRTKNLGDALRNVASEFLSQMRSEFVSRAANSLMMAGFSALGANKPIQAQNGMYISGSRVGDRNPALLEDGEYVLNRNAVKAMGGPGAIDTLNFGMAPRFNNGGMFLNKSSKSPRMSGFFLSQGNPELNELRAKAQKRRQEELQKGGLGREFLSTLLSGVIMSGAGALAQKYGQAKDLGFNPKRGVNYGMSLPDAGTIPMRQSGGFIGMQAGGSVRPMTTTNTNTFSINVNVGGGANQGESPQGNLNASEQSNVSQSDGKKLAEVIQSEVAKAIQKEQRPGGILTSTRSR